MQTSVEYPRQMTLKPLSTMASVLQDPNQRDKCQSRGQNSRRTRSQRGAHQGAQQQCVKGHAHRNTCSKPLAASHLYGGNHSNCSCNLQVVELYKDITAAFEELANEPDAPKPQTPMNPE